LKVKLKYCVLAVDIVAYIVSIYYILWVVSSIISLIGTFSEV